MKDAEHFFEDGKAPTCFLTHPITGRRVYYWGPYRSKLSPGQRGLNGIEPKLTGSTWNSIVLDTESYLLHQGIIASRGRETAADRLDRLKRAKAKARMNAEDARAKGIRS